ncbi:hypothetical protein [Algoriphagus sp. PAP.12]|uniref:hypothetical protein n=1 Tax=Algoriphagus sp. PAP.12 TaxID=2996678 RepID=UPI00227BE160|nr:hypothetical protein [Algoriphagus sp. PAP.12]
MKKIGFLLIVLPLTISCSTPSKSSMEVSNQDSQPLEEIADDYIGNEEDQSLRLGKIEFSAENQTLEIQDFGIDPYTVITWFTPESGIASMAGVVFKSHDFQQTVLINFSDFDSMETDFIGEKEVEQSQPIISFGAGPTSYMFSEGKVSFKSFSRKTGKVTLRVEGKCNKTVLTDPSALKTGVEATLIIDAWMPYASIDGLSKLTEAAEKFHIKQN